LKPELTALLQRDGARSIACRVTLRGKKDKAIQVDSRFSIIKDKFGDMVGILFIGNEIASVQKLRSLYKLTAREIEIIRCIYQGVSNREIAVSLGITERTVKSHLSHIFNKLDIKNKIQLITLLEEYGLVPRKKADKKLLFLT